MRWMDTGALTGLRLRASSASCSWISYFLCFMGQYHLSHYGRVLGSSALIWLVAGPGKSLLSLIDRELKPAIPAWLYIEKGKAGLESGGICFASAATTVKPDLSAVIAPSWDTGPANKVSIP